MDAIDSRNPTNLETKNEKNVEANYLVQDYHLNNTRVIVLDELPAREIYLVLLLLLGNTPTS